MTPFAKIASPFKAAGFCQRLNSSRQRFVADRQAALLASLECRTDNHRHLLKAWRHHGQDDRVDIRFVSGRWKTDLIPPERAGNGGKLLKGHEVRKPVKQRFDIACAVRTPSRAVNRLVGITRIAPISET